MSISYLLFFAMFISTLLGAGKTLEMYDPSKTPRWNSQHGWNLSILALLMKSLTISVMSWPGKATSTQRYAMLSLQLL